jgi:biotin-(acetyl-CoA carboxylase) ligase
VKALWPHLMGKEVRVTLDDQHIATGTLIAYGDDGEIILRDEMGFLHWCWPALNVEAVNS